MLVRDKKYWIGLSDLTKEGTFTWTDGSETKYAAWDKDNGQPDGSDPSQNCAAIWSNRKWHDVDCSFELRFVCKKARGLQIPPEFEYQVRKDALPWREAQTKCANWGGDLASIHNTMELAMIKVKMAESEMSTKKFENAYWIGANDIHKEGKWEFSDGTPMIHSIFKDKGLSNSEN